MALALSAKSPTTIPLPKVPRLAPNQRQTGPMLSSGLLLLSSGVLLAPRASGGLGVPRHARLSSRTKIQALDVEVSERQTSRLESDTTTQLESAAQKQVLVKKPWCGTSPQASNGKNSFKSFSDCLDIVNKFSNNEIPEEFSTGVATGWPSLDALYRPVRGEVTVVTGTPGSGKSEFLFSLALNLARTHGWRFHCVPFEHKQKDWAVQMMEKMHEVQARDLRSCSLGLDSDADFLADHFTRSGAFSEDLSLEDILVGATYRAQELRKQGGLHGLIIDPYNCIARPEGAIPETEVVSAMMSKLQQFAKLHATHVWIVVHPTKHSQLAGNEPSMYDCSGSAHWFNKCDNGIIVRRPYAKSWAQQRQDDKAKTGCSRQVNLKVDKVRNYYAGKIGEAKLLFSSRTRGFEEAADIVV